MSASRAIKAGKAWVELAILDRLDSGLAKAKGKLLRFARSMAIVGTSVMAASTAVLAVLGAAADKFQQLGSQMSDLSQSTGLTVEELSALRYAAIQSAASVEDLATGMNGLAKFTLQVQRGSTRAAQTLSDLKLSAQEFLAATPHQRLLMVADALARIGDPGIRSGLAQQLGMQALLPLLNKGAAGIQALIARAKELGVVITTEQAQKASALGDAWNDVKLVFEAIAVKIGGALADTLTTVLELTTSLLTATGDFIANNQGLVVAILAVAAAGLFLGGVLVFIAVVSAVLAAIWSPAGLIVAGIVLVVGALALAGIAFLTFSEQGRAAAAAVSNAFIDMANTIGSVLKAVFHALTGGRFDLVGTIIGESVKSGILFSLANLVRELGGPAFLVQQLQWAATQAALNAASAAAAAVPPSIPKIPRPAASGGVFGLGGGSGTAASAFNAATAMAINRTITAKDTAAERTAEATEKTAEQVSALLQEVRTKELVFG